MADNVWFATAQWLNGDRPSKPMYPIYPSTTVITQQEWNKQATSGFNGFLVPSKRLGYDEVGAGTNYPISATKDQCMEMLWRAKRWKYDATALSVVGLPGSFITYPGPLTSYVNERGKSVQFIDVDNRFENLFGCEVNVGPGVKTSNDVAINLPATYAFGGDIPAVTSSKLIDGVEYPQNVPKAHWYYAVAETELLNCFNYDPVTGLRDVSRNQMSSGISVSTSNFSGDLLWGPYDVSVFPATPGTTYLMFDSNYLSYSDLELYVGCPIGVTPDEKWWPTITFKFYGGEIFNVSTVASEITSPTVGGNIVLNLSNGANLQFPYNYSADVYPVVGDIIFEIAEYWPYANKLGQPIWDTTTGERTEFPNN